MSRLRRKVLLAIVGILILGLAGNSAVAQERPQNVVSINVRQLVRGSIHLQYERVINPGMSLYVTPILALGRDPVFGVSAGIKKYVRDTAPEASWYGASGTLGIGRVMGISAISFGAGAFAGYKYFITDRFTIEVIAGLEYSVAMAGGISVGDLNVGSTIYIGYAF